MNRDDLTLNVLFSLIEYELWHIQVGCKLSFIVIDFFISKDCNVEWQKAQLHRIVDLVRDHPARNVIRFRELFCTPDLTIPDTLTSHHRPPCNYFPIYRVLNEYIKDMMGESGTRSIFRTISNHVGMTTKQKSWKSNAWEGFNPANWGSITSCNKLTLPYQRLRSYKLVNIIESKVRAFPYIV